MAKNPENVWSFEKDLIAKVRKKAEADVNIMLKIKSDRNGNAATTIDPWEAAYYENLVLKKNFNVFGKRKKRLLKRHAN